MQPDPQRAESAGSIYGIPCRLGAHHQTRRAENPIAMGFFDRFIDRQRRPKVIGSKNKFFYHGDFHLARRPSRVRVIFEPRQMTVFLVSARTQETRAAISLKG